MLRVRNLMLSALLAGLVAALALVGGGRGGRTTSLSPAVLAATADGARTTLLVVLRDQAALSPAPLQGTHEARVALVALPLREHAEASQTALRRMLDDRGVEYRPFYIVNMVRIRNADRALASDLVARADVKEVLTDPDVRMALPRSEPILSGGEAPAIEPGIWSSKAPPMWAAGIDGSGIVVGSQDTGQMWNHEALLTQYRGWDGASADHDYHWRDAIDSPEGTGNNPCGFASPVPCDDLGHGTHTIGTAVGGTAENRIGMAPGARWIGCRNMNDGVGTPSTYLDCFEFFLAPYPVDGTSAEGDPAMAPHVTVNSWNCPFFEGCDESHIALLEAAVDAHAAAGILTIAAAGNEGPTCGTVMNPPGTFENAYTVGALQNGTDRIASFSSRGPVDGHVKPNLSAPGTAVRSANRFGSYGYSSGTSMATPHVAGAVALLWQARPALRGDLAATRAALNDGAYPLEDGQCGGEIPNNVFGHGRLDICAASGVCSQPRLPLFTCGPHCEPGAARLSIPPGP